MSSEGADLRPCWLPEQLMREYGVTEAEARESLGWDELPTTEED